ncbi:MAG: dual specificity protein phosphatase family protein [Ktedonobacterales bacterium]
MKIQFQASKITPYLYQGTQPTRESYQYLKDAGVTAVLSMNRENPHIEHAQKIFGAEHVLLIPWRDDGLDKPVADFRTLDTWLDALGVEPYLYVHCAMGINRSTIGSIWILMREGLTGDDAFNLIVRRRPVAAGWAVKAYKRSVLHAWATLHSAV